MQDIHNSLQEKYDIYRLDKNHERQTELEVRTGKRIWTTWLMTAAGPVVGDDDTGRPMNQNDVRASDPLPSTDHVSGTDYRRQFTAQHCQLPSLLIDSRPICSFLILQCSNRLIIRIAVLFFQTKISVKTHCI